MVDLIVARSSGSWLRPGTAFVRDRLDDRLRAPNEMEEFGAGPVLAVIPPVRHGAATPATGS